jgi:hypothetical protein
MWQRPDDLRLSASTLGDGMLGGDDGMLGGDGMLGA